MEELILKLKNAGWPYIIAEGWESLDGKLMSSSYEEGWKHIWFLPDFKEIVRALGSIPLIITHDGNNVWNANGVAGSNLEEALLQLWLSLKLGI